MEYNFDDASDYDDATHDQQEQDERAQIEQSWLSTDPGYKHFLQSLLQ